MKISELWEKRSKDESPYDVVYGRLQGKRVQKILEDIDAKEFQRKHAEAIAYELGLNGKKVLDAGIGPLARFSSVFPEFGADVNSIDISKYTLKNAEKELKGKKVNLIVADMMNLPFKDGSFDISFCVGTIYHMPGGLVGVRKALKELARVTRKKDGFIYFEVENYLNPINWPQIVVRNIFKLAWINVPHHTYFNYISIQKLIRRSDLLVIDTKTAFDFWGPLIFLPLPILKVFLKIWLPLSEFLSRLSKKIHFLRMLGVGWYLKVENR